MSEELDRRTTQALSAYKDKIQKDGLVKVEYTVEGFGRFKQKAVRAGQKSSMAAGTAYSGTMMMRVIRALVFEEKYEDLDICNASGTIMTQLFKKYGLECPYLDKYVADREACLSKVMKELEIERATAKNIFIEIFFGGSGKVSAMNELLPTDEIELPKICRKISKEYKSNIESLLEMKDFAELKAFVDAKDDKEKHFGQYASIIYHEEERHVLEAIFSYITEKANDIKNPVGALIFDGLHVRKEFEVKKHLKKIEAAVLVKTGYDIKVEVKDFGVTDEDRKKYLSEDDISYEAQKELFEKTRFKVDSKFVRYDESLSGPTDEDLVIYDKSNFQTANEDWIPKATGFLVNWFSDPKKRKYDRIELSYVKTENRRPNVFYACPKFAYLKFSSSSSAQKRAENIAFFTDYIKCLAEDKEEYTGWFLDWLADIFQNPDTKGKTPTSVILWGSQGSGKSFLTEELMRAILGHKFVHRTSNPIGNGDVLHDFNKSLRHKILIEFAEINLKTHAPLNDRIKDLITANYHNITLKGKDSIQTLATERYIFTTNNSYSLVVEKDDRRYAAFHVSNRLCGNTEYWNTFSDKLLDTDFISDISEFLLTRDISKVCLRDSRPITSYYKMLKTNSLAVELDFMKDLVIFSDPMETLDMVNKDGILEVSSSELFSIYNTWRDKQRLDKTVTQKMFYSNMLSKCSEYGVAAKHTNTGSVFRVDTNLLKKKLSSEYGIEEEIINIPLSRPVFEEPVVEVEEVKQPEDICARFASAMKTLIEKEAEKLKQKEEKIINSTLPYKEKIAARVELFRTGYSSESDDE
jgi:hypothetical protein